MSEDKKKKDEDIVKDIKLSSEEVAELTLASIGKATRITNKYTKKINKKKENKAGIKTFIPENSKNKNKRYKDTIIEVCFLMIEGWSDSKIRFEFLADKQDLRSVEEILVKARQYFETVVEENKKYLNGRMNEMLLDLYFHAKEAKYYKVCNDILANMARINKLNLPEEDANLTLPTVSYLKAVVDEDLEKKKAKEEYEQKVLSKEVAPGKSVG